jgi:hypothetical protein
MLRGTVDFQTRITRHPVKFSSCEFNPHEPGVEKIVMESLSGHEIHGSVHLSAVASAEEARVITAKLVNYYLDRFSFLHGSSVETHEISRSVLTPIDPQPAGLVQLQTGDLLIFGQQANLIVGLDAAYLQTEMELAAPPGERFFGMYRSALQSASPVEQFMHLYQILLLLSNDRQADVDAYIRQEEPGVPETQHPQRPPGVMETVYSRLRNEFGHVRVGVDVRNTKAEMADRLGGLIALTRRAIELNP